MKKKVHCLGIFLLLLYIFPTAYASTLDKSFIQYDIEENSVIITQINSDISYDTIVLPTSIDNFPVKKIAYGAFQKVDVKTIVIPEGIEELSGKAIVNCPSLKTVVIPASCTLHNGASASCVIEYCESLETIEIYGYHPNIPIFVADCPNLKRVIFHGDVENTVMNGFRFNFYKCNSRLKEIYQRTYTEPITDLILCGIKGSQIEYFANENGFAFEALPEEYNVSDWAKSEVEKAFDMGLVPQSLQDSDLTKPITRDEFAAIAVKVFEILSENTVDLSESNPFTDTSDTEVLKAYAIGITAGISETEFAPNARLDREQASTMLARAFKKATYAEWSLSMDSKFKLTSSQSILFADDADISDWAKDSVYFMAEKGILKGVGNNVFAPKNTPYVDGYTGATRQQALLMAIRMVENLKISHKLFSFDPAQILSIDLYNGSTGDMKLIAEPSRIASIVDELNTFEFDAVKTIDSDGWSFRIVLHFDSGDDYSCYLSSKSVISGQLQYLSNAPHFTFQ